MNTKFTILNFDTELFGFKVAKILSPRLEALELQMLLMQLGTQDVRLVYWASDSTDATSQAAARQMQGLLGSQQVTYKISLHSLSPRLTIAEEVKFYEDRKPSAELENLATEAGNYSHFRVDPKFPHNLFLKLYSAWINNSVNGKIADAVLVVWRNSKVIGVITVAIKNNCGSIGLLAVDSEYRGQGIGAHLIRSAQAYWRSRGATEGCVITQLANKPARHLYEKEGFKIEKIENFYHFWLQ